MNPKFKLLLVSLVFLPILLAAPAGVSFAGPLDILDAPGSVWGRIDEGYWPSTGGNGVSHIQFEAEQGIRFIKAPWIEPYVSFSKWQETGITDTNWFAAGVKNNTWLPPFTFGLEYQDYIWSSYQPSGNQLYVAYISVFKDWNLFGVRK